LFIGDLLLPHRLHFDAFVFNRAKRFDRSPYRREGSRVLLDRRTRLGETADIEAVHRKKQYL
jgi:hypothetical protein